MVLTTGALAKKSDDTKADSQVVGLKSDVKTVIEPVLDVRPKASNRFTVDEIICTVHGPERTHIFTQSDTRRAGLAGAAQGNIQDLIFNELTYQRALHLKLPIPPEVIDNYIATIQQQHNLSMKDVEKIFKTSGYTLEEGRKELEKMYAVNSLVEMELKANLIVPEHDVIAYYEAHPIKHEAQFKIQRGFAQLKPEDDVRAVEKRLDEFAKKGTGFDINWSDPVWFAQSDVSDKFQFITTMEEGQMCKPLQTFGGFELYKLIEKKPEQLVPLKERYRDIVEELRKPKFEHMYTQYTKQLMDSAAVIYFEHPAPAA